MYTERGEFSILVRVFDGNLGLTIWAYPWASTVLTDLSKFVAKLSSERMSKGHQVFTFITGISKHMSLIACSYIFDRFIYMYGVSNFRRLLFESHNYLTGVVVTSFVCVIVSDLLKSVADNGLEVYGCFGCDFTENHHHIGFCTCLTCNSGIWVLSQTSIKDSVGDLITELVRMPFIDRF